MSVTFVQKIAGSTNGGSTTATATLGSNVASGNLLIVAITMFQNSGTASVSSVTDNKSNTYTLSSSSLADTTATHYSHLYTQFAYAIGAASGSTTVTANLSTTVGASICVIEATPGVLDKVAAATGNSATPTSSSVTTTGNGSFAVAIGALDDGFGFGSGWFFAGSGWTFASEQGGGNQNGYVEYQAQTNAGAIQGTCTSDNPGISGPWAASIITFKPSDGAAFIAPAKLPILQALQRAANW